jgi:hypothetical protein
MYVNAQYGKCSLILLRPNKLRISHIATATVQVAKLCVCVCDKYTKVTGRIIN